MKSSFSLKKLDLIVAALALAVLVAVTFTNVFMRYLFAKPLIWAEEVQLLCFLWMTFMGAGAAFRYGSHVAIEVVVDNLPHSLKRVIEIIDYILVVLILGYVCYLGMSMMPLMLKIGKHSNILHIPFWLINVVMPIGCAVMILCTTSAHYQKFFRKKDAQISLSEDK